MLEFIVLFDAITRALVGVADDDTSLLQTRCGGKYQWAVTTLIANNRSGGPSRRSQQSGKILISLGQISQKTGEKKSEASSK